MTNLSIEEKIAQMLVVDLDRKEITDTTFKMIREKKIGGVVLYSKNYNSYSDMILLVNNLKKANLNNKIPLFISIDQEGGRVNRMPKEIHNIKRAYSIAKTGDIDAVRKSGELIGKILQETGVNLDYAPVLDIKRFPNEHAIGDRCYGENKEDVVKYGMKVMTELQEYNVLSVVKHFPRSWFN